jgi:hypothetical protein
VWQKQRNDINERSRINLQSQRERVDTQGETALLILIFISSYINNLLLHAGKLIVNIPFEIKHVQLPSDFIREFCFQY